MADEDYPRFSCVDCSAVFARSNGAGRPRIRCHDCSPKVEPKSKPAGDLLAVCAWMACRAQFKVSHASTIYCGPQCRIDSGNWAQHVRVRRNDAVACAGCGVHFSPLSSRRNYCTELCRISAGYRRNPGSTHRRRAKRFGCEYAEIDKVRVFERDGWRCQLCGVKTPKTAKGTRAANAPELDHIVPMSRGGAHRYENVHCACRACNAAKGARPLGQVLMFG